MLHDSPFPKKPRPVAIYTHLVVTTVDLAGVRTTNVPTLRDLRRNRG
jgi:hypothetical protein